ncbi:hypothetical protein PVK06_046207 [Gossypium arboreum]|uniref:Uncharacterized protein n=1 Tax=Gossypium arboreum TaxID=29729 RepID=A0ABR0MAC5_GOSAR|nr:hypothetical protein PVK06_046207 [Gossypium arboreum]
MSQAKLKLRRLNLLGKKKEVTMCPLSQALFPSREAFQARTVADLQASVDFLQKLYDKAEAKAVKKINNKQKAIIADIRASEDAA